MNRSCILPDVNLLLAYGWQSHPHHKATREWFSRLPRFATCAITELGFLRVSMSPAYRANYSDAQKVLASLTTLPSATFLKCEIPASRIPTLSTYKDITGSYLTELARHHSCRLATLDEGILKAAWAKGVAYHPHKRKEL